MFSLPTRTFAAICTASLALYLAAGYVILSMSNPEPGFTLENGIGLVLTLPVIGFIVGWLRLEGRLGRPLVPALAPYPNARSAAHIRTERKGLILLVIFGGFIALASPVVGLMQNTSLSLSLTTFAGPLVWIWILKIYGWRRMRFGMIHMMSTPAPVAQSKIKSDIKSYMTAHIQSHRLVPTDSWDISARFERNQMVPMLNVSATSKPDPDSDHSPQTLTLDGPSKCNLLALITEDGNPYRLLSATPLEAKIDLSVLSQHERMGSFQAIKTGQERALQLFAPDDYKVMS